MSHLVALRKELGQNCSIPVVKSTLTVDTLEQLNRECVILKDVFFP